MRTRDEGYLSLQCSLFLFLSFGLSPRARADDQMNRSVVDVGVILDMSSWIGNISWSCMPMALDDFYAVHRNYTTRLNLHLRDSGNTSFGAAEAALDLLKNVQVQAIIGPQASSQAKFVIELGNRTHVPVISFSANSPSLSPQKNPYFIRTGLDDSFQAEVIASIIQAFNWKEVVPIFEDTDYGNGIVPSLIDSLQEVEADVPYRSSLPLLATDDQIMAELVKLNSTRTRVFVVHMTYSLGFQLFKNAKEAGMMGQGYVWITTYGLTDLVDLMGSSASDAMQGVLGLKPFVRESKRLSEFKLRWRKKFYKVNPGAKISEPTVFGLWAYDTVWSLAMSAESAGVTNSTFEELNTTKGLTDFARLGSSLSGPVLRKHIVGAKFDGISGQFDLIAGHLESKAFEIINVLEHGKKTIGFWTPANRTSGNVDSKEDLKDIIWPGGHNATPKGWVWPTMGKELRIGIPVKPGFDGFVRFENGAAKGYCIEVFDAVMSQMPYNVPYRYYKYEDSHGQMNGTYDDLVYQVYLKSSYTANLTSKLTVEQLLPTVSDISDLLKNGDYVGYLDDSFMPGLLKRLNFQESKMIAYQSPEDYNEALSNGTVAAIFDEIPYVRVFLNMYCNKFTMTGPTYKTDGFGFAFPIGSPLVPDVSRAVLKVMEGKNMTKFEKELYGDGNCSEQDDITETSTSLRFVSFWGLFLITGIASLTAVILYITCFLYEHLELLRMRDSENSVRGKLASLAKAYDQWDPSRASKKPEAEVRPAMGDIMLSPFTISGPQSPFGEEENFEIEEEAGTPPDEEEIPGTPGREISSQNPDPPSFAEMLTDRNSGLFS